MEGRGEGQTRESDIKILGDNRTVGLGKRVQDELEHKLEVIMDRFLVQERCKR